MPTNTSQGVAGSGRVGRGWWPMLLKGAVAALALLPMARATGAAAQTTMPTSASAPPSTVYLFTSFRGNGEDGLHLAYSTDGLTFTPLNDDRSFLQPRVGKEKLMRDPNIARGPDGTFHMVWTDSWTDRTIGYASSKDLIHWSEQRTLPVMEHEPAARNCWAPEINWDEEKQQFLIYWSTTIPGRFPATDKTAESDYNHRIYCTTTKDFQTFSPTRLFYDGGFNAIDATILKDRDPRGDYLMFIKDESKFPQVRKHLRVARARRLEGPYEDLSEPITESWVEGPTAIRIGEYVHVYYDAYTRHHYRGKRSKDGVTWEDISDQLHFPKGTRHGSIMKISPDELRNLQNLAPKPLYRDPVYDGAADPIIVWNREQAKWTMLYTNRRANVPGLEGVAWVHGTPIGIAISDDGARWRHIGNAKITYAPDGEGNATYWAPDVVYSEGVYHMFLSYVPGVFSDWNHPRRIVHLTSKDLVNWEPAANPELKLASDRVIDASLFQMPDGQWRMWYNDERTGKSIHWATSPDLNTWTDQGLAKFEGWKGAGEGPKVFRSNGSYWMIVDHWKGLGVYRSDDAENWTAQDGFLLGEGGTGKDDGTHALHADVTVGANGRAYLWYFTHPGRVGEDAKKDTVEQRRSSIQVTELFYEAGKITARRNEPTSVRLVPSYPNPLIEYRADPHIFRHTDGYYYMTASVPEYDLVELRRARTIEGLAAAEPKVIWRKPKQGRMGGYIWAPEIHFIDGKWFIYFAAGDNPHPFNIRIYALSCDAADPLAGEWTVAGQVRTQWESFALDAHRFTHKGKAYLVWAQHEAAKGPGTSLYIDEMTSPTTLAGRQTCISSPTLPWERIGHNVNEGPAVLVRNGRVFLAYSASATDANYCMGLLTADEDADLLDPASWKKSPDPVFKTTKDAGLFGPGHNSFTVAEDGVTDLMVFHGRSYEKIEGEPLYDPNRATRIQVITWNPDGTPNFGAAQPDSRPTTRKPSVRP